MEQKAAAAAAAAGSRAPPSSVGDAEEQRKARLLYLQKKEEEDLQAAIDASLREQELEQQQCFSQYSAQHQTHFGANQPTPTSSSQQQNFGGSNQSLYSAPTPAPAAFTVVAELDAVGAEILDWVKQFGMSFVFVRRLSGRAPNGR